MKGFLVAGGSVPGTNHTKPGQPGWANNQDAFAWNKDEDRLVAVLCDGCSSTPHAEVGAKIGAKLISQVIFDDLSNKSWGSWSDRIAVSFTWVDRYIPERLLAYAQELSGIHGDYEQVVLDYFLFTVMGVVMTPDQTVVFSLGDGVYAVNGEVTQIEAYEGNAPPYLGYACMHSFKFPGKLKFEIRASMETKDVNSILIGSDGVVDLQDAAELPIPGREEKVGPLSQFWTDDKFVQNPDAIRRRLAMMNVERVEDGSIKRGLLPDDTTLIVIKREP
jgi:hypothetical protein